MQQSFQKNSINTKSVARLAAVQTIYLLHTGDIEQDINTLLFKIRDLYKNGDLISANEQQKYSKFKPSYKYLEQLVKDTHQNMADINQIITNYLTDDWTLEKLPKLLLANLQVGISELKFLPETPVKVVIDEYTNIAANLLGNNEMSFINSVLDKFSAANKPL